MKEIKHLVRCEKGHFYDAGRYESCPHCQNTSVIPETEHLIPDEVVPPIAPPAVEPVEKRDGALVPPTTISVQRPGSDPRTQTQTDTMTVHYYQKTLGSEPVVGWLVCINGVHFGQDFRIKSGRNFLGRGGTMDIRLSGDMTISRDRHLIITYDPKGNTFYAQPGDTSSGLSYLNEKPLLEATELNTGDKLTVGESELVFVAFCGETFTWEK